MFELESSWETNDLLDQLLAWLPHVVTEYEFLHDDLRGTGLIPRLVWIALTGKFTTIAFPSRLFTSLELKCRIYLSEAALCPGSRFVS